MNPDTKRRIELVIDAAIEDASSGVDVWTAARGALVAQQSDVYRELALAALVDTLERRLRSRALETERAAERDHRVAMAETVAAERSARNARWAEQRAEEDEKERARLSAILGHARNAVSSMVHELKIEWTAELLDTVVALGDGTKVAWGEATYAQHDQRASMLERNGAVNLEAAARHRRAMEELEAAGAETLRQMTGTGRLIEAAP